eukprot:356552-Chlamydomonas_euryale.AAC.6
MQPPDDASRAIACDSALMTNALASASDMPSRQYLRVCGDVWVWAWPPASACACVMCGCGHGLPPVPARVWRCVGVGMASRECLRVCGDVWVWTWPAARACARAVRVCGGVRVWGIPRTSVDFTCEQAAEAPQLEARPSLFHPVPACLLCARAHAPPPHTQPQCKYIVQAQVEAQPPPKPPVLHAGHCACLHALHYGHHAHLSSLTPQPQVKAATCRNFLASSWSASVVSCPTRARNGDPELLTAFCIGPRAVITAQSRNDGESYDRPGGVTIRLPVCSVLASPWTPSPRRTLTCQ